MRYWLIFVLILTACSGSDAPTATTIPTQPPPTTQAPPTETPVEVTAEATPEVYDPVVTEADLLDPNGLAALDLDLRFSGLVNGRLAPGNRLVDMELQLVESVDEEVPSHYSLRLQTGEVVEDIRTVIIVFRADLEAGTYPIDNPVTSAFTPEIPVLASIIGGMNTDFGSSTQGFLRLQRDRDTFTGSFTITGGGTVTVQAAFGPISLELLNGG